MTEQTKYNYIMTRVDSDNVNLGVHNNIQMVVSLQAMRVRECVLINRLFVHQ